MAKRDRDQEKKRRRQKRQEKKRRRDQTPVAQRLEAGSNPGGQLETVLRQLETLAKIPLPTSWPGASDPSLERPDKVKFEFAQFATAKEPGKSRARLLEQGLKKGLLGFLPEIGHWGMEEFLWHGLPGDSWHPIDAYLAQAGDRFPPAAQAQLRLWKEARIGLYEIGEVHDATVDLREWDPVTSRYPSPPLQAIALNIGGINIYRGHRGEINVTYLAPWAPAGNLFCAMGYGMMLPRKDAAPWVMHLGLRHPGVVATPLPWHANRPAAAAYLRQWRTQDWQGWLGERLQFPFLAVVTLPPDGRPALKTVRRLLPSTAEHALRFGIYLEVEFNGDEVLASGATTVTPVDVTSPNLAALAEYQAYRDLVGPPPGMVGMPGHMRLR